MTFLEAQDKNKYGRKGAKARKAWLKIPEKQFAPETKVYVDALWMRVHEENCSMCVLKSLKKPMTLEEADKAGYRIGESGQTGRERCCFKGYRRKYSEKDITDETIGIVALMKSGKYKFHMAGCHRLTINKDQKVVTKKEAMKLPGAYMCEHCKERGPSATSVNAEELAKMPANGPAIPPYLDPLANLEEFMGRRFFFGYSSDYNQYRSTGDKASIDALLAWARHYHKICVNYPSVAQAKARDPEHLNFLFPMAGWSRIMLQLARKYPDKVTQKEIDEAEAFLKSVVVALMTSCEGDSDLDSEMGIPKKLADDFRRRAFNRAANGIGTVGTTLKALEDLQIIKKTKEYQSTIDRYRKCVQGWIKNWKKEGCLYTEADGKKYFYYPYSAGGKTTRKNGLLLGGADVAGHFQYSVSGSTLMFEAVPELGVDDEFMTAIANAVYHNSTRKNGSIQCPSADKIKPLSRHPWSKNPKLGFYVLEAFRDGLIIGQNRHMKADAKQAAADLSRSGNNLWDYFKALRKDRSLINLGETKSIND